MAILNSFTATRVGIAQSVYPLPQGLEDGGVGVRVPIGSRIFSSSHCPDRFWEPPSLLFNGYSGHFPR
jgi:hypothetical protein